MASIQFVIHPLPGTDDQLNDRLRTVAEKLNRHGASIPPVLQALKSVAVNQCVVSPGNIAFLLQDGRVCRISYAVQTDKLDLTKGEPKITSKEASEKAERNTRGIRIAESPLVLVQEDTLAGIAERAAGRFGATAAGTPGSTTARNNNHPVVTSGSGGARPPSRHRTASGRVVRAVGRGRGGGVIRPFVPASVVPEELINQCQIVLQGKSRNLIIRELQRTNLDVNLAVNNLLSRDDEGEDDTAEDDPYMSDDLMSLLDANIADHPSVIIDADSMYEDMFGYPTMRSRMGISRSRSGNLGERDAERDRDSLYRIRGRWLESSLREENISRLDRDRTDGILPEKKTPPSTSNPIQFGEELQFWPEKHIDKPRFSHIAALHSELVAVTASGQLCQWKWTDPEPYHNSETPVIYHPKTCVLCLANEKIIGVSATSVRASVWTESGRVATWVDETLGIVANKVEHPAMIFPELISDRIISLHTCPLYTCAWLESGTLCWWGIMPFDQRKKMIEKSRTKGKRTKNGALSAPEVVAGCQVCLRNSPIYHAGAIAFRITDGIPKVGQLLEAAWSLGDTCRFKIKTHFCGPTLRPDPKPEPKITESKPDMPPPPSPASSTCSDHSGPSIVSPGGSLKRKKQPTPVKEIEKKDEDTWPLKDVIFVEDVKTLRIGKVLKVDGAYAAVRFSKENEIMVPGTSKEDLASLLQDCRLLRKDELQIVKSSSAPRVPECFQKLPKKVTICENGQIMAVNVDNDGIHAIVKTAKKLSYMVYTLSTGKVSHDSIFPTDITGFMGVSDKNIKIHNAGEASPVVLRDGNGAIYPLSKDQVDGVKDPLWLDLPPLRCLGMGIQSLSHVPGGPGTKNRVAVIVMSVESQSLIPTVLRCDSDKVTASIKSMEEETNIATKQRQLQDLLQQRCDGNRNLVHTVVAMSAPTANKDPTDNPVVPSSLASVTSSNSVLDAISVVTSAVDVITSIQSRLSESSDRLARSVSLREMMRRATSAARAVSGMSSENDREETGMNIPTLSWPPDPPPYDAVRDPERPSGPAPPSSNPTVPSPSTSREQPEPTPGNPLSATKKKKVPTATLR